MDMIKEFISKATPDQIKEISKSCMDRQEGLSAFERLAEDSEVVYECPEGWIESEIKGVAFWENEEDGKLVAPCEDVNNPECIGEWNKDCDDIIW